MLCGIISDDDDTSSDVFLCKYDDMIFCILQLKHYYVTQYFIL